MGELTNLGRHNHILVYDFMVLAVTNILVLGSSPCPINVYKIRAISSQWDARLLSSMYN
jgi:hypothetical protein